MRIYRKMKGRISARTPPSRALEDGAIGPVVARAGLHEVRERAAHVGKLRHLRVDLDQVFLRQGFHVRRGATTILPEREKRAAILDREAQRPGPGEKAQLVDMGRAEPAVAIGVPVGRDQPDLLVIADGLGRQARPFGHVTDIHAALTRFSRSAFATTRTELAAIAPAANMGFNSGPPNSARPPAATGISATL
jgi:hypothetical protein